MFQRDLNILAEPTSSRNSKIKSLEKILAAPVYDAKDLLLKSMLKLLSDPVEKCREYSIQIIKRYQNLIQYD
jgi:hypothetical protein